MSEQPRPSLGTPRPVAALLPRLGEHARLQGDAGALVTGASHDSRLVGPGDLYVARAGAHTHGIVHVAAAVAAGATVVLTDPDSAAAAVQAGARAVVVVPDPAVAMGPAAAWAFGDPALALTLWGVTGTNGKTTTAYLMEAGLRAAGRPTGLIGTIETRIGDHSIASARTTPEATDLQALLARMVADGVDAVAMEVSSHALALHRVDGLRFAVAAFTNLSQDHLDFHRDMAAYHAAKLELFTPRLAHAGVVCVDDEGGRLTAERSLIPVVTTGAAATAQWRRRDERVDIDESVCRLVSPDGAEYAIRTRLAGRVNLSNACLAFASLVSAGIDPQMAAAGIADLGHIPGRMERVGEDTAFRVYVDYAHTPAAVMDILATARALAQGHKVIVVLGCGGDRDAAKRPLMGAAAAQGADLAIFTSDNPRSEDPQEILTAMLSGVPQVDSVVVQPDRARAIAAAVSAARPGDVVIVAGKGHETGQQLADRTLPFDDREVVRAALAREVLAR